MFGGVGTGSSDPHVERCQLVGNCGDQIDAGRSPGSFAQVVREVGCHLVANLVAAASNAGADSGATRRRTSPGIGERVR